jgi:NhaP-type Na+/H+ or K+/H+ antiporter
MRELTHIRERLDVTSLAAGIAIVVLGALVLLQEDGSIDLEAGWLLAALAAATGVVLVASGLGARRG